MPQFSLKRLFVSVTLIAGGCGVFIFGDRINKSSDVPGGINLLIFVMTCACIGAGVGNFYKRPVVGAIAGPIVLWVLAAIALLLLFGP